MAWDPLYRGGPLPCLANQAGRQQGSTRDMLMPPEGVAAVGNAQSGAHVIQAAVTAKPDSAKATPGHHISVSYGTCQQPLAQLAWDLIRGGLTHPKWARKQQRWLQHLSGAEQDPDLLCGHHAVLYILSVPFTARAPAKDPRTT
jgi:hypothetical protein